MARADSYQEEGSLRNGLQKLKGIVVFTLLFLALVFFAVKILSHHTLPIKSVQIGGKFENVKTGKVKAIIKPLVKGNFFTIEIDRIQTAVEAMIWVDRVSVKRVWPDTLRIYVYEHKPLARWHAKGLISTRGIYYPGKLKSGEEKLPVFAGPENYTRSMAQNYLQISKGFARAGLSITHLKVNGRRSWTVVLSNGIKVRIGRKNIVSRSLRLARVYPAILKKREKTIKAIDLRYTNGFAVQWKRGKKSKTFAYEGNQGNG